MTSKSFEEQQAELAKKHQQQLELNKGGPGSGTFERKGEQVEGKVVRVHEDPAQKPDVGKADSVTGLIKAAHSAGAKLQTMDGQELSKEAK